MNLSTNDHGVQDPPGYGVREYLAFKLGNEEYGIDLPKVQEIRGCDAVTELAGTPAFLKGVINLRGIIVPIVDMRIRFQLFPPCYNEFTVVIIMNITNRVVGMVVDSVSEVITLDHEQIKPTPDMGMALNMEYVTGLGTLEGRILILVDIDRLISPLQMEAVAQEVV